MQKFILGSLLLGSIGFNVYLLNTEVIVKDDLDSDIHEMNDKITIAQSAVQKSTKAISGHKKNLNNIRKDFLPKKVSTESSADNKERNKKTNEEYEEEYQKSQINWKESLTEYMEVDLGLLPEHVEQYFEIQKEREAAISEYMMPKFNEDRDGMYYFGVEDNIAMGKINEKYLIKLKSAIGADAYQQYSKFRRNYNKNTGHKSGVRHFVEF